MPAAQDESTVGFPTWDSLVADAHSTVSDIKPYRLPLGDVTLTGPDGTSKTEKNVVLTIPCPDGVNYLTIIAAQRVGDSNRLLNAMVPDPEDRKRIVAKMTGVPYPIVDVLTGKVLRHYYGLSIEAEEKAGNSPSS